MSSRKRDKLLREILDTPDSERVGLIRRVQSDAASREALEHLRAKGYVEIRRAWGDDILDVFPTDSGKTYFQDRAARRREKWLDRLIGFIAGVLTTVAAHFIIEALSRWPAQ